MGWKEEYKNLILNDIDYEKIDKIKSNNFPNSLYKYRMFDENGYWKDWILGNIFLNPPSQFNDPYDCLVNEIDNLYDDMVMRENAIKILNERVKLKKIDIDRLMYSSNLNNAIKTIFQSKGINFDFAKFERTLQENKKDITNIFRNDLRIACFSTNKESLLLWSHYASSHQGFCIEYDFSMKNEITKNIYPVIYVDKYKKISNIKEKGLIFKIALIKAVDWKYEDEWRLLNIDFQKLINGVNNEFKYQLYAGDCIKAIYIGAECNKKNLIELKELADKLSIPIFRMKKKSNEYALQYEEF